MLHVLQFSINIYCDIRCCLTMLFLMGYCQRKGVEDIECAFKNRGQLLSGFSTAHTSDKEVKIQKYFGQWHGLYKFAIKYHHNAFETKQ